jgi:hypothetical protein
MEQITPAHHRFLQRRNDTLYVTELSGNRADPAPTPELLHELRAVIDRFAEIGLTRDEARQTEVLMTLDDLEPATHKGTLTTMTRKITRLVCRYETQRDDQIVEESFKFIFDRATELTVPHTRHGLVAHAIGAFLPHCTELATLHVHTCDHARLRRTIHTLPSLRLTVIRNDASNGFWNAAALALFAQLRREDQVRRQSAGYNAVVVAHTNASRAFSAPEWALATYLFMRNQGQVERKTHENPNGEPMPGYRYVLHDFADGAMQQSLDAAFAIVCAAAAETESKIRPGVDNLRLSFLPQPASTTRRIEYSSISPDSIVFAVYGRNVFRPYIEQFSRCPRIRMHLIDNREFDLTERERAFDVQLNQPPISIRFEEHEIEQSAQPRIVFGRNTFQYNSDVYNIEHDLLLIKFREVLNDENRVSIYEVRPTEANEFSSQVTDVDVQLAQKLRRQMPALLPRVHIESKSGGMPASRALLAQSAVQHLVIDFQSDNRADGINHENPNHGREYDVFVRRDDVVRPVTSNLPDICALITDMRRIDKLTLALKFQFEDTDDTHIASNQMRSVLNSVVAAQCGIPRLEILNVPGLVADACLLHLMHRTDACLLMDLALEVRARPDEDGADAENIAEIELQHVIGERAGVICRQLLSLTITTLRVPGSTFVRMDYLPDLLDACTNLQHLNLDLQYFHPHIRQRVQAAILRMAPRLRSFQFRSNSDSMANNASFTAAFLRDATHAAFAKFDVAEIPRGINDVADALVTCLSRPVAEQINVTCLNHDAFAVPKLNRLYFAAAERGGSNVGLCFRANFRYLTSATQASRILDDSVAVIARQRNRETDDPLADYRSYRTPSNNDVFVEIGIEEEFKRLEIGGAMENDVAEAAEVKSAADDDGTNRAENLAGRDYVRQMAARRAAQSKLDKQSRLGAYRLRELTPAVADNQDEIDAEVQAAMEAFAHAGRIEVAEAVTGRRPITRDVRARHRDIQATKQRLTELLKLSGTAADAETSTFDKVLLQLTKEDADKVSETQECDREMERQGKCYSGPVEIESSRVLWGTSDGSQLGAFVPFAGERAALTIEDRRAMNAVTWDIIDPIDYIPISDPRGDIVVMTAAQQHALEAQLRIDQLHRTLWLFAIAEEIRLSPATTVWRKNFAPEVQMAASRAAYQAYYTAPTSTLGCATFGRFFVVQDYGGEFALRGFPAPGSRPQDAHASIRVARYPVDIVPGPRAVIFRGGHRMPAMEYQCDSYGVVFGNESAAHPTVPARYGGGAVPLDVPLVGDLLRRAMTPDRGAYAVLRATFDQLANLAIRFPSGACAFDVWLCYWVRCVQDTTLTATIAHSQIWRV